MLQISVSTATRVVGAAVLVGAVVAAPAGAAKDPSRYRTAGAVAPAVATPAATSATLYAGTTSYGLRPLVVEVRGGRVSRMVAQYGGECFSAPRCARR